MTNRPPTPIVQMRDTACEAIASIATEDKKWVPVRRIQQYFADFSEIEPKKVERHLLLVLKELEKQEILIRKGNSLTFRAMETVNTVKKSKKPKEKKKPEEKPKKLGPDVVLTSSGRISYRTMP
jgi:hypothetical protein